MTVRLTRSEDIFVTPDTHFVFQSGRPYVRNRFENLESQVHTGLPNSLFKGNCLCVAFWACFRLLFQHPVNRVELLEFEVNGVQCNGVAKWVPVVPF